MHITGFSQRALRCGVWVFLLLAGPGQAAPAQDSVADPALEARVQAVAAELRCLVCQNQNLADSHAELALDLKNQVREQLRAGRTSEQVVAFMTERYGDFVRYRPPFNAATALLWLGPALLLVALAWGVSRAVRRQAMASGDEWGSADEDGRATRLLALGPDPEALRQEPTGPQETTACAP
jgi:cytochrome c-type biogenesis protein CcmH/NrfF